MNRRSRVALRTVVIVLGGLETLAFLAVIGLLSADDSPLGIGRAMVKLIAIPYVAMVVPSLSLAVCNRWLPFALVLNVLALPFAVYLWIAA
jgi:hypothetical protein